MEILSLQRYKTYFWNQTYATGYFQLLQCTKETFILGQIKEMSKTKQLPSRKEIDLELLHQTLGHRSTRSLLAGDTANVWEDIELRIYPDPFCTSCKISSMNKKARSKIPLKTK